MLIIIITWLGPGGGATRIRNSEGRKTGPGSSRSLFSFFSSPIPIAALVKFALGVFVPVPSALTEAILLYIIIRAVRYYTVRAMPLAPGFLYTFQISVEWLNRGKRSIKERKYLKRLKLEIKYIITKIETRLQAPK